MRSLQQEDSGSGYFPVIRLGSSYSRKRSFEATLPYLDPTKNARRGSRFLPLFDLTSGYFWLSKSYNNLIRPLAVPTVSSGAILKYVVLFFIHNMTTWAHVFSSGEWFLRVPRESAVYQKVTHGSSRNHGCRAHFSSQDPQSVPGSVELKEWNRPSVLPCKRYAHSHTHTLSVYPSILSGKGFCSHTHQIHNPRPVSPSLVLQTSLLARHT